GWRARVWAGRRPALLDYRIGRTPNLKNKLTYRKRTAHTGSLLAREQREATRKDEITRRHPGMTRGALGRSSGRNARRIGPSLSQGSAVRLEACELPLSRAVLAVDLTKTAAPFHHIEPNDVAFEEHAIAVPERRAVLCPERLGILEDED